VLRTLRRALPDAYLGMAIAAEYKPLMQGHPDLNALFLYDKKGEHRSVLGTFRFARQIKEHGFDTVLILHSTNRAVLTALLAGIPRRVGYDRRLGWLLTDPLRYRKSEGDLHEIDYNLALVHRIGVSASDRTTSVALDPSAEAEVKQFLDANNLREKQFAVLHPGASCPSKRWPEERFAQLGDRISKQRQLPVVVVTGPAEKDAGERVIARMKTKGISACGRFSIGELAWLLKKASVLISNDSGPVHIASAVETPVVSIFGRWGGGLSPARWGPAGVSGSDATRRLGAPAGSRSVALHHDIGCRPCLAHRCTIGFVCLNAVTVDEAAAAVDFLLRN
jgi:heptosyltransferase-2